MPNTLNQYVFSCAQMNGFSAIRSYAQLYLQESACGVECRRCAARACNGKRRAPVAQSCDHGLLPVDEHAHLVGAAGRRHVVDVREEVALSGLL